jgi:hypothetical protein
VKEKMSEAKKKSESLEQQVRISTEAKTSDKRSKKECRQK